MQITGRDAEDFIPVTDPASPRYVTQPRAAEDDPHDSTDRESILKGVRLVLWDAALILDAIMKGRARCVPLDKGRCLLSVDGLSFNLPIDAEWSTPRLTDEATASLDRAVGY